MGGTEARLPPTRRPDTVASSDALGQWRDRLVGSARPRQRGADMRRLLSFFAALAVASLLAAPVSAAAPLENGWDTFTGNAFNPCTGEVFDNHGSVHTVLLANGFSHS